MIGIESDRAASTSLGAYYTPEREQLQQVTREFAMTDVLPIANRLDPVQGKIPIELRKKMADLGLFALLVPSQYGGVGLGVMEDCVVTEELSRAGMSVASIIGRAALPADLTEEQRIKMYPKVMTGEYLGAGALSEPDAGSDLAAISCHAHRDGDDWVINGQKMWCTNADDASFISLLCRSSPRNPANRREGIGLFFIEKEPGTFPVGILAERIHTIGYHGWYTFALSFDDFRVPASALLRPSGAFEDAASGLFAARLHTAARAIGLARGGLEDATQYALDRVQFNKPIASFQAIRFKLANMATEIEVARQMMYYVAHEIDEGRGALRYKEAAMAKLFATEMSERVTSEALQIHGGYGYTTDFAVERYWRDARLTKIFEGTSELQQHIIDNRMLGPLR